MASDDDGIEIHIRHHVDRVDIGSSCSRCSAHLYFHERGQPFCRLCADELGIARLCDRRGHGMVSTCITCSIGLPVMFFDASILEDYGEILGVPPKPGPVSEACVASLVQGAPCQLELGHQGEHQHHSAAGVMTWSTSVYSPQE